MRDVPFAFFASAVLCVTLGMAWGIEMGIRGDHSMSPAHAHLNLVGWATLALFGIYYRLTPQALGTLARIHAAVAVLGVAVMVAGLAIVLRGGSEAIAIVGSLLSTASMLVFLFTVLRHGFDVAREG